MMESTKAYSGTMAPMIKKAVPRGMERLKGATNEMQAAVDLLEASLETILQPAVANETPAGSPLAGSTGQLAYALDDVADKILSASARMRDLVERLEL